MPIKKSGTALILFYAVCLLYVLSAATFVSDLVAVILHVSNNSICKNTIFLSESVVQTRVGTLSAPGLQIDSQSMSFHISIIQATAIGCRDFLAQCILSSTHKPLYLSSVLFTFIFKDLPLLDRVGSKYPCRDHFFILSNRIVLRSVILSSSKWSDKSISI